MLPISKQKFQSTAATLAELALRVTGERRRSNLRGARIFWIMSGRAHLRLLRSITTAQLVDSSERVNKRAATGRNKRSPLIMTERDKVRDAPSLGKQAATGSSVLPHGYNLSGRDIYL
ncbi:hypothetical protein CDAR_85971 [Caerostris darwini]|uniref:Uncharacterized protein n=1 Tax=Caerostris darwini TaxID=1538125 RepID=A0AAV4V3Y3_9ARAC|nr:hypothetical protein CDAR_85971 [Caerostris darwini]